ncbi:metal-dependent hydrolase [Methylophaga sp. OBS3]|uniref:metal-dependent hydrolase n=1 Tax=Methylophaga sp. OBS3 TaxID=2991934 RepID=UPI00225219D3|nr:metal-dependent hydrolase [Methylophaga sp. OBS3]MCX4189375.1 metal-dependent hydrolase [Methylophaga sp. OBS3]
MDTVTQALLGGAVGYLVAGKKAPRKALLTGAAIAVLPDLDVFISYANDLDKMTLHRSWTHSWLIQTLLAPILALLISYFDKTISWQRWTVLIWLALVTHSALDALTVYGTQLFWPFMPHPASGGSVFIIDPIYSLLLLAGFIGILFWPSIKSRKLMLTVFSLSMVYLGWGLTAQQWVTAQTKTTLIENNINYQHFQVSAAPLNTLLWRIVVVTEDKYYQGFRSVFDGDAPLVLTEYDRGIEALSVLSDSPALTRIEWFTRGLYKVTQTDELMIISDLRMGMEPYYFFRFRVATFDDNEWHLVEPKQVPMFRNSANGLRWVWQRIWHQQVEMKP